GDGLADSFEYVIGTKADNSDSDSDDVLDGDEVRFGTDPNKASTNGHGSDFDQLNDGTLVRGQRIPSGYNPPDYDGDGIPDAADPDPFHPQPIVEIKYPVWLVTSDWKIHTELKVPALHAPVEDYYIYIGDFTIRGRYGLVESTKFNTISSTAGCGYGKNGGIGNFMKLMKAVGGDPLEVSGPEVKCEEPNPQSGQAKNCPGGGIEIPNYEWRCDGTALDGESASIPCDYDYLAVDEGAGLQRAIIRFHEYTSRPGEHTGNPVLDSHTTSTEIWSCSPCCPGSSRTENKYTVDGWRLDTPVYGEIFDNPSEPPIPGAYSGAKYSYDIPRFFFEKGEAFLKPLTYPATDALYNPPRLGADHKIEVASASLYFTPLKIKDPPGEKEPTKNKYVFDNSTSGKMAINVEALVPNDVDIRNFTGSILRWEIDAIERSRMIWSNAAGTKGKGIKDMVTFFQLPRDNLQFGTKNVTLEIVSGTNQLPLDTVQVKVFFSTDAQNHPTTSVSPISPNWFYYWRETSAGNDGEKSDWDWVQGKCSSNCFACTDFDYAFGRWLSWFVDNNSSNMVSLGGDWGFPSGIDNFAWVVKHEKQHRHDNSIWWPNGYNASLDTDGDGMPDSWECPQGVPTCANASHTLPYVYHIQTTPSYLNQWGGFSVEDWNDAEHWTLVSQEKWFNGSSDLEDWACPGKQSDNLCP
ncbi:MAG: hypothetical protein PHR35_20320, partial [Kiritimatiellae bacterium]|nr:hypothetical protein [Kiritimatiellia bacterium]